MSGYFWNSGGDPGGPPSQAPPPAWGGWGGMYQGPHGIQGGGVPGGAVPPHVLPWVQNLLASQGGPMDRINTANLPPFWQQIGLSAAPTPVNGGVYGNGVGLSGNSGQLSNPTGSGQNLGQNPSYGTGNTTAGNPGEGPNGGPGATGFPPAVVNAFQNYVAQRYGGNGGGAGFGVPPRAY